MFRAATVAPATDVELVNQKERERGKVKEREMKKVTCHP
jgi:hypothetical protein